ncbi:MAG: hypothetical protein RLZZ367_93 [Bacteroidota bacterium]|jgi:hypothetical protein
MHLSEVVSIPGLPGLFKISARRNDGLIVTSLVDDKTQFVSGRNNLFSTLDNITIYTDNEDTVALKEVLAGIKKSGAKTPDAKNDADLKAWMEKVLPNYDKTKVHTSDMKKLAKWYAILDAKNLIDELTSDKAEGEENTDAKAEVVAQKETKHTAAKADKGAKATSKPAPVRKVTTPRKAT